VLREHLQKIFIEESDSKKFWIVNNFLAIVIIASVVLVLLETNPALHERYQGIFTLLEYLIGAVFTIEYLIYIYLAPSKRAYIFSFYGIIDLLAILPTFLALANLQFLKTLRIVRLLRLFRLFRLLKILRVIKHRYGREKAARELLKINLQIYFVAFILLTIVFSIILFHIEEGVPGTQIRTIQDAMWSVMSALSSVGFGNAFPASFVGKLFLGFVMIVGVGFLSFAILTLGRFFQMLIFGEEIAQELEEFKSSKRRFAKKHRHLLEEEKHR